MSNEGDAGKRSWRTKLSVLATVCLWGLSLLLAQQKGQWLPGQFGWRKLSRDREIRADRKLAVPLSQVTAIDKNQSTDQAIADCEYWEVQGYLR